MRAKARGFGWRAIRLAAKEMTAAGRHHGDQIEGGKARSDGVGGPAQVISDRQIPDQLIGNQMGADRSHAFFMCGILPSHDLPNAIFWEE
jgi:hypothetical protein